MPWEETCAMAQKVRLVADWLSNQCGVTELSLMYNVSRKTVYKWTGRYALEGPAGLEERSRRPGSHPNATAPEVVRRVIAAKLRHQKWGPKKVTAWLKEQHPDERWPAASTAGEILRRQDLVRPRKRKRRTPPYTEPFKEWGKPNEVWSADFKGQFKTKDGRLCYPLTITDNCSRYLLGCRGLSRPTCEETQPWFEWVFREYGLPEAIRTDNGVPFASVGLGGLSRLSIWLIKLGVRPERIEPGHPEQNGRHERMHRSLKESAAQPPKDNLEMQQRAFNEFVHEYNFERPHEALGQKTPSSIYRASARPFPFRLPKVEYGDGVDVRRVRHNGEIKWRGRFIYVSQALAGEPVALQQKGERLWEVHFSFHPLGVLNLSAGKVTPQGYQQ